MSVEYREGGFDGQNAYVVERTFGEGRAQQTAAFMILAHEAEEAYYRQQADQQVALYAGQRVTITSINSPEFDAWLERLAEAEWKRQGMLPLD